MGQLRVMTFNIRGVIYNDGINDWAHRAALNVSTIKQTAPDIIGFQELQSANLTVYQHDLADYQFVLGPKAGVEPYGYNAIFWHPSRVTLLKSGGFWLSETPEQYSASWNTRSIRAATWARFRDTDTASEFLLLNTHLDHISDLARVEGSALIIQQIMHLAEENLPVLLAGDFNCNPGSVPYNTFLADRFIDTFTATGNQDSEETSTYHAFGGAKSSTSGTKKKLTFRRLDWILLRDPLQQFHLETCAIIQDHKGSVYPSDHYPVLTEFTQNHR